MTFPQILSWGVLVVVLALIASGRMRMEIAALGGLLVLGVSGVAPPAVIFSGFGHPALATIIAVFFISQGIVNSGLMRGLGQNLAKRMKTLRGQVISIAGVGAILSAFMNNVGAAGLMLPTAVRMAARSGSCPGTFGLPLAVASILGGTLTLIGSAPNIIIAAYMYSASGQSFKMFDFAPHGLAMVVTALVLWLFCKTCGIDPGATTGNPGATNENQDHPQQQDSTICSTPTKQNQAMNNTSETMHHFAPLATRERKITLTAILVAVILVSLGLLHPAFGFGAAALVLIVSGVLKPPEAYQSVDMKIVFFLGAMLGIGQALEHTAALDHLATLLGGLTETLPALPLILVLIFLSSALSNAINNAAAAVFMAPLAVGTAAAGNVETAAALMAVAAGSNMTLLLPTHQAALMIMSKAPFSTGSFMRFGIVLTIFCGVAAALIISLVWQ